MSQRPATRLPSTVKEDLTAEPPSQQALTKAADPTFPGPQDRRGEHPDYAAFATRVIRGHARRIAVGDIDGLRGFG